jgi:hypothetical protein
LEALHLHLERARDREGSSETAWCTDYWRGECPGRGCWWRELKLANQPEEINKNGAKNGQFPTLSVLKLLKTPFFSQKYLIRYSRLPRYFLRNTLILRFFVTLGILE